MTIGHKRIIRWAALTTGVLLAPLNGCQLGSTALTGLAILSVVLFLLDILNTPSSTA
jgi:hypothetical protein